MIDLPKVLSRGYIVLLLFVMREVGDETWNSFQCEFVFNFNLILIILRDIYWFDLPHSQQLKYQSMLTFFCPTKTSFINLTVQYLSSGRQNLPKVRSTHSYLVKVKTYPPLNGFQTQAYSMGPSLVPTQTFHLQILLIGYRLSEVDPPYPPVRLINFKLNQWSRIQIQSMLDRDFSIRRTYFQTKELEKTLYSYQR